MAQILQVPQIKIHLQISRIIGNAMVMMTVEMAQTKLEIVQLKVLLVLTKNLFVQMVVAFLKIGSVMVSMTVETTLMKLGVL